MMPEEPRLLEDEGLHKVAPNRSSGVLLSLCMCGRDDDYMADFSYRITTTLNQLGKYLDELGESGRVEVVIADWGSEVPLAESLELTSRAADVCRFVYVPPSVIRATQDGKKYFHAVRALNAAIRLSRGEYILTSNADQLIAKPALDSILRLLDGRLSVSMKGRHRLMMVPRVQVPWQYVQRRPGLDEWERFILMNEYSLPREDLALRHCLGASGGLLMLSEDYRALRGFDESHSGWGWSDIEFGMRAAQTCAPFWLSAVGVNMFHMGHPPSGRRMEAVGAPNTPSWSLRTQVNDDSWGLAHHDLREMRSSGRSTGDHPTAHEPSSDFDVTVATDRVRTQILGFMEKGWRVEREELTALAFLGVFSGEMLPRRFLNFQIGRGMAACVVAGACPSVELYGVDRWEGVVPQNPALKLSHDLTETGFHGRIHFLNGDPTTALARLQQAYGQDFQVDLISVRSIALSVQNAAAVLSALAPGGAMVIGATSRTDLDSFLMELGKGSGSGSLQTIRSADGKTGMVLKPGGSVHPRSLAALDATDFDDAWLDAARTKETKSKQRMLAELPFTLVRLLASKLRG